MQFLCSMEKKFPVEALASFTKVVFRAIGCSEADATTATAVLLQADLRGVDSHGIARLSG
ncbi:MAG: Ldh family oxidoreductase [Flavihumibacter sp.]